jgi:DNA-binding response OmpR family regulator
LATTILIVEDDYAIRDLLAKSLRPAGYTVVAAMDGVSALQAFEQHQPALVVLDLMLPTVDGWEVCRQLRARSQVPILMLTALNQSQQEITGLDLGADDYVTKPFDPRNVLARIRALLRRAGQADLPITVGPLALDPAAHTVTVDDRPVALTPREFALLAELIRQPQRVFTRAQLLERCWEPGFDGVDRVVDVHISSLRRKLGHPELIVAVRGQGYRLV